MKKRFSSTSMTILLCFFCACGGSKSDYMVLMDQYFAAVEELSNDIEKAKNAEDVVQTMDDFTKKAKIISDKTKTYLKELIQKAEKGEIPGNLDKELKDTPKRMEKISSKLLTAYQKAAKYTSDPRVQEARKRMSESLAAFNVSITNFMIKALEDFFNEDN